MSEAEMAAEDERGTTNQGIKSIEVGARVLGALERGRGPMSLSEVAAGAGLHPSKVHRYLVSLVRTGLAAQSVETGLYNLGPVARALGVEALRRTDPVSVVSAYAMALRDESGHTVNVAVWGDAGPELVRWDTGAHALPIVVRVGSVLPLLDSAVGLVFFTYLDTATTAEVLRSQQEEEATGRRTAAELREIAESVRRDGFAATRNKMILGLSALAAPVFGADGSLEAVIGLVLPTRLMTEDEASGSGKLVRETAHRASQDLGFTDGTPTA
jgi:DNA-binding IclR family transcriptional regulator